MDCSIEPDNGITLAAPAAPAAPSAPVIKRAARSIAVGKGSGVIRERNRPCTPHLRPHQGRGAHHSRHPQERAARPRRHGASGRRHRGLGAAQRRCADQPARPQGVGRLNLPAFVLALRPDGGARQQRRQPAGADGQRVFFPRSLEWALRWS